MIQQRTSRLPRAALLRLNLFSMVCDLLMYRATSRELCRRPFFYTQRPNIFSFDQLCLCLSNDEDSELGWVACFGAPKGWIIIQFSALCVAHDVGTRLRSVVTKCHIPERHSVYAHSEVVNLRARSKDSLLGCVLGAHKGGC